MAVRRWGVQPTKRVPVRLQKPEHLQGYASQHWDCIEPLLGQMGVLHPIDCEALTALCQWWAEYRTLQATPAADSGEVYKRAISLASAFKNWSGLASRFGLTPKDREKLSYVPPEGYDTAAEFIA